MAVDFGETVMAVAVAMEGAELPRRVLCAANIS